MGSDKQLKEFRKIAARVNELEPQFQQMDDATLRGQTARFKERYANGESLDDMLPEAFASVREASQRTIGQRHFDVQLVGGIALHRGTIAEMKTGEGKTLVSTLAGYLNAISGEGVHIVTVNDYLAKRDSEWMGRIYGFMGLSVGLLQNGMRLGLKRPAYAADVTYGTNSEFGFDYLRDNMVTRANMRVQRGHHYAIVDEVDSILIDEARTPLIISGAGTKSASTYQDFAAAVRGLKADDDYEMDEAKHTIAATEKGLEKIERALGIDDIYGDMSGALVNHLQQALKAEYMFHRDQQYAVIDGEVKIVDEFTGRIMEGRRYSEGLHQAIEAKEGVLVREENQTLAAKLLPPVRKAQRHDGYRHDGGRRVPRDLQPSRTGNSAKQARNPQGQRRPRVPHHRGEVQRGGRRHYRAPRKGPAVPGGHRLDRELREALGHPQPSRHTPQRAQRQVPRARGADCCPGWS